MAIHFTRVTPAVSDLTLHLRHSGQGSPEQQAVRATFFPSEWFAQSGVQLTWPHAETDWEPLLAEVDDCFLRIAIEILLRDELLLIVTPEPARIRALLHERMPSRLLPQVRFFECPTNDTWARDHAFLTLMTESGPRLLDYQFNGWGLKFASHHDNQICRRLVNATPTEPITAAAATAEPINAAAAPTEPTPLPTVPLAGTYVSHLDFVFEGGSIESDGAGTLLTTSACLLSPNRNPLLTRQEIEGRLLRDFHAQRLLWLDHGYLAGDDTDSHIDTLARFCATDTIAYVQCTDSADEHYTELCAMEAQLRTFTQTSGKPYQLIPLPLPAPIYDPDDGHRLPATYANFLILNGAVLLPTYGQSATDDLACRQLQRAFPRHAIIPVDCRVLIRQHGSLHCSTMQYPVGVLR